MKTKEKRKNVLFGVLMFLVTLAMPNSAMAQDNFEIKDFNQSFTFTNTHYINLRTNTISDTISGIRAIATFNIDKNGNGSIYFESRGMKTTVVYVNYSQIRTTFGIVHWNFGCTHSEKDEKIQMTIEINPKSNSVKRFTIYNEGKEKAYVFH